MRLAWFTPWPPQSSGIAGRSAELVPRLAADGHAIDVYVHEGRVPIDRHAPVEPVDRGEVRVLGAHDFVWRHARQPYDLPVYQVGNSVLHDFIWPYLFRWPGLSILHDARLHHARGHALLSRGRADMYRAEFTWAHPGVSPDAAELGVLGLGGTYLYGWPMTRAVLAASRLVAVHSRGALADLEEAEPAARLEYVALGEGRTVPWTADERRAARAALGLADQTIAFGLFGALTEEKRVPQVLAALGAIGDRHPHVRLLLAGADDPAVDVDALARRHRVTDRVHRIQAPDDEAFDRAIAAVDVCLCLRWPSALETSGPWLRALAAGRPTVIIDLPHQGHVPTLDPRGWRLHAPAMPPFGDEDAVAVALDVLDEAHSLTLALARLAGDAALRARIGQRARAYWESAHTVDRMVADVERALVRAASFDGPAATLPDALRPDPFALARRLVEPFGEDARRHVDHLARRRPGGPAEHPSC
ncbi:MAG TPA: glycosyltransferase family 4 protein [Vicinamibacterales bacterium]|nr:glycosyltransferase family 4 protein [Vicinamibacterales bacterium]